MRTDANMLLCYKELMLREAARQIKADGFEAVHLFLEFEGGRWYSFPYRAARVDLAA